MYKGVNGLWSGEVGRVIRRVEIKINYSKIKL